MSETKFEMGPVQKMWVQSLKDHPERQVTQMLGRGTPDNYQACCLGEFLVCYSRFKNLPLPFFDGKILDVENPESKNIDKESKDSDYLQFSWDVLGLRNSQGTIKEEADLSPRVNTLSRMNDGGKTWTQIAEFVELNPEVVFIQSV